jgi:hypothetical protein
MPDARKHSIVVAGDLVLEWNFARRPTRPGTHHDQADVSVTPGGAALLGELLSAITKESSGDGSDFVVHRPRVALDAILPSDNRFHHSYELWSRFDETGTAPAWRVASTIGFGRAREPSPSSIGDDVNSQDVDLLVLDDDNLGFRDRANEWQYLLDSSNRARWILLRMAGPIAEGGLWERLQDAADRVIVLVGIDDLRLTEVTISRELSWERTSQDLMWELLYNPRIGALRRCAHIIVSFGTSGALVLSRSADDEGNSRGTLVFDPLFMEETWSEEHPGRIPNRIACLSAAITRQLARAPNSPDIILGVQRGISAMRALHLGGYDLSDEDGTHSLAFPTQRVASEVSGEGRPLAQVEVSDPVARSAAPGGVGTSYRDWTILEDQFPEGLEELARRIVLEGPDRTLKGVPIGRFGKLLTVDRHEIEGLRSIRNLIREYSTQTRPERPVSIAVFGPPGSGKSFGVKEVARGALPGKIATLTFNLSQFDKPDELLDALHQVRDVSLGGMLPLVFWDEFDTALAGQPLGWLRHFLAPMQDGSFQEGQVVHPIGPAVFVFAGGTSARIQDFAAQTGLEFRRAKGPDFLSRLKGYVNVLGPNPQGGPEADPYYLLRRAVLLRVLLMGAAPQMFETDLDTSILRIDPGVLRAFLLTRVYRHGARSMESVVAMSSLSGKSWFERSCLPAEPQLELHVNAHDFLDLVHRLDVEGNTLERLAEAAHVVFCAARLEEGFRWGEGDVDYLRRNELLTPFAQPSIKGARTHSALVSYEHLPEEVRDQNRELVRDIPNKLAAVGYSMRPARSGEPAAVFDDDEVELLAEQEHERWLISKLRAGWRFADDRADEERRHPALLPWRKLTDAERVQIYGPDLARRIGDGELSESEKDKDRELIRGVARILQVAGFSVAKIKRTQD